MISLASRTPRRRALPIPSATLVDLCRVALWCIIAVTVTRTIADGDLWGHVRFGLDMLATGTLHTTDPYSFTADREWVNHEWLAELAMAGAYSLFGSTGLILLKVSSILVVGSVVWTVAAREDAWPLVRDLFVAITIIAAYVRLLPVRPQMFSVAIFCVLLYLFTEWDRGRRRALWIVPVLFALWPNFHGGWIVGFGVLAVWSAGEVWQSGERGRALPLGAVVLLSLLATLLNPYGIGMWQFLAETVRPARPDIADWTPLLRFPPAVLAVQSILPLAAMAALWKARSASRLPVRDLAVAALLALATFRVGRVDAFFQIAVAVLFAPQLIAFLNGLRSRLRASERRDSPAIALVGVAAAVCSVGLSLQNLGSIRVDGYWIPDQAAAVLLRDARPGARVLTWFDWGQYAIWQLSPAGITISMDGRRETVYSERVVSDHFRFYAGAPEMVEYPDRIGADHVWLPSHFRIIDRLEGAGWKRILDTGQSVVLARGGSPIASSGVAASGSGAFPWP